SSPKVIVQILITGTQIFGKALFEAGRQAVKNAKYRPQGGGAGDAQGVGNATTGSVTDKLTREHLLTLDEAHLILNLKKGDTAETMLRNYEHLFKANSPPPKTTEQAPQKFTSSRTLSQPISSHYLLSKVVRARERIEAE
ncbi:hypothetical protein SISSUDRAFT_963073, partial [Sistotremastrum suecicum HHB10207 ss-3]